MVKTRRRLLAESQREVVQLCYNWSKLPSHLQMKIHDLADEQICENTMRECRSRRDKEDKRVENLQHSVNLESLQLMTAEQILEHNLRYSHRVMLLRRETYRHVKCAGDNMHSAVSKLDESFRLIYVVSVCLVRGKDPEKNARTIAKMTHTSAT